MIEQVKATGEQAALDPMTAFERKVVHDEVLAAGLSSESDGVEPRATSSSSRRDRHDQTVFHVKQRA